MKQSALRIKDRVEQAIEGDSFRDICKGVSAKRSEARARLSKEAQPGTTWGADDYKFGVLVLGEVVRGSVRCHRFDGEEFLGHMDVLTATKGE